MSGFLGCGNFVSQVLSEADLVRKYRLANLDREKAAFEIMEHVCKENDILIHALMWGSRLRHISSVRHELALRLTAELGLSFAEVARLLGVSTSGVARIIERKGR
jgi:DNA-directed RNA polymerase specialized sigma subunit